MCLRPIGTIADFELKKNLRRVAFAADMREPCNVRLSDLNTLSAICSRRCSNTDTTAYAKGEGPYRGWLSSVSDPASNRSRRTAVKAIDARG
jgi:hypothetical protein